MQTTISIDTYIEKFNNIRNWTLHLCTPLQTEDFVVQPIVDVSPPKWHLGHTTWFFEQFILKKFLPGYKEFHPDFSFVFNSYYESLGKRVLRAERGNLTRPSVNEVKNYREYVDERINIFLKEDRNINDEILTLLVLGFNHEQQHQELLLTDLKYILGHNPLFPSYTTKKVNNVTKKALEMSWLPIEEGVYSIGYNGKDFHFDNEKGLHKNYLSSFEISDRLLTNGEYLQFIEAGGYKNFEYWLQEGFQFINDNKIISPLYWHLIDGKWYHYTLNGLEKINPDEPVSHVSFYEADAFAKWKGLRLPTEFEWEVAARIYSPVISTEDNFVEKELYKPQIKDNSYQFFGEVWEWTNSAYLPYPFYVKEKGAVGEYNGKFMINQMVLRGGSCATPFSHIRHSYRNFFHPDKRWQFSGIRLARNIE